MLIDWFTVSAQVLNFVILVWLMRRFLYQPILNAIDAREKRIAATVADAVNKEAHARKERDDFEQKNAEFEQHRNARLQQVEAEVNTKAQRLLQQAELAAEEMSQKREARMRDEAKQLNQVIGHRLQREVIAITRKVLVDLADASLENKLVAAFIQRLQSLDPTDKNALITAIKDEGGPVLMRSSFNLSSDLQSELQLEINKMFADEIAVRYETDPKLIGGVELICNGQKLAWSIKEYISSWETALEALLSGKSDHRAGKKTAVESSSPSSSAINVETTSL